MTYLETAIERSRTTLSVLAVLVLAGLTAYMSIPVESDPDIAVPFVVVTVPHEGISPEDAERLLARPLEVELRTLSGLEELDTYSSEGAATAVVEFTFPFDPDQAVLDVREAVNRARAKMPSSAEEPIINEISASDFPIISIGLSGSRVPERVLYRLATELREELEAIPDVLSATLEGAREEVLEAVIDPAQLEVYGISNAELLSAVSANNRLIAAGTAGTGRGSFSVKIPGLIESSQDVLNLPVKATPNGVITLADLTQVRRTFKDAASFTRTNGLPSLSVEVTKRSGTNLLEVVGKVREVVDEAAKDFPASVTVSYLADQAPWVREQVSTLQGNIVTAMFLVLTVVVAAVGLRSGILVALGIPISFMFAFIVIDLLGFTYNFMVMFGMLLGLGMLIDGAIVVVEFADRKMAEGMTPKQAFVGATRRMFWPVVASTGTTLAAFLPLMFWPGVTGSFMRYLPVTVFAVLVGSLAYALLFAPVLGAKLARSHTADAAGQRYLATLEQGDLLTLKGVTGVFTRVLRWAVYHPLLVLSITALLLGLIIYLYVQFSRGLEVFIQVEPNHSRVLVSAQGNFSPEEARDLVVDVENRVFGVESHESIYTRASAAGVQDNNRIGVVMIEHTDRRERETSGFEVEEMYREAVREVPGLRVEVQKDEAGPPIGKELQIAISSENLDLLIATTRQVRAYVESLPGAIEVSDSAPAPGIEWQIEVDRVRAAMAGANFAEVGTAVQLITNGVLVGRYRPDDSSDEVDIRVRYPESQRSINRLEELRVQTQGGPVPISSLISRTAKPKVSSIHRLDGKRVMFVSANTTPDYLADDLTKEVMNWVEEEAQLDPSVSLRFRGANEEQNESTAFVTQAFLLSLFLMGILLVTQFNNFYQALLILSAVIMSTVGVLLGLLITNETFSVIMSGVGIVALAGIIVNNNIVLIDTYNVLQKERPAEDLRELALRAGVQRLRPVFLTTFTTGFGLLPLAMGFSVDLVGREVEYGGPIASFWVKMSSAIVSGLTFATALTLIVTPALLMLPGRLAGIAASCREKLRSLLPASARQLPEAELKQL